MGGLWLWHAALTLLFFIGVPVLAAWLVMRSYRNGAKEISSRLERLGQLRQQGLVTEEEFERKRAELARKL